MGFFSSLFGKKSGRSAGTYGNAENHKDSSGGYAGTNARDMAVTARRSGPVRREGFSV